MAEVLEHVGMLFPGQGSQHEAMGNFSLWPPEAAHAAYQIYEIADDVTRRKGVFKDLDHPQPALLTVCVATYSALKALGYEADVVAGHSLGEYAAMVVSGFLRFESALQLVQTRQDLMEAAPAGSMAAVRVTSETNVAALAKQYGVEAANYNSTKQIVMAGPTQKILDLVENYHTSRLLENVHVASHCSLMTAAQAEFNRHLQMANFSSRTAQILFISSVSGSYVHTSTDARVQLASQLIKPVLWTTVTQKLTERHLEKIFEVGPGHVLARLAPQLKITPTDSLYAN